jgi:hypothetical protein
MRLFLWPSMAGFEPRAECAWCDHGAIRSGTSKKECAASAIRFEVGAYPVQGRTPKGPVSASKSPSWHRNASTPHRKFATSHPEGHGFRPFRFDLASFI